MLAIYRKEMRSYFINPIGYIYLGVFLVFSALLCCYTTLISGSYDTTSYFTFLIISFVCAGFSTGMSAPDGAVVTRKLFGEKHYQVNFEVVMSCGVLNAFAATFVGGLYDLSGGYILPMFILAGLGLVGFVCSCLIKKP